VSLTARDIAEITRLLEESTFDELELELNGMKIHLRRSGAQGSATQTQAAQTGAAKDPAAAAPPSRAPAAAAKVAAASVPAASPDSLIEVRAPLLGTFYRAPKPGAPPFVEVGAQVEPDSIVGIIEVMKLMNTVRAGTRGVVREIRARDGVLVEYGETLLLVDPREPR